MAALALLIVGGMALVNAVMSEPDKKGPATGASPSGDGGRTTPSSSETKTSPTAALPLVIRVTGQPTKVVVRVADAGGKVLANGPLNTGDTLQFKESPLQVVASNGGAVQVVIYGKVQPRMVNGQRGEWFVKAR
ncbi:RodZ domain-containing protein [Actinomadura sp. WMMA1423]|uniref:RodZ domain-containing protein n=1 Tax=Actinomadura sp. WMMA1423 TaxID=2591108 RepID=UPI0011461EB8|nr:RodZ domain-containing protein [Actinomadura sp. WMMA1423]